MAPRFGEITNCADSQSRYVLLTAAHNEEASIERVLRAVTRQTLPPLRWVIVSDGCTDGTDAAVKRYASQFGFIKLVVLSEKHERNFAAQVHAIQAGYQQLSLLNYQFIGNLDADVEFQPNYFSELLERFSRDARLGLAGGWICELKNGTFTPRKTNRVHSVAHAVQMFRRECFEAVGGYLPLPFGGPDFYAEVQARMKGWKVSSFPELTVEHYRAAGPSSGWILDRIRQGRMDFSVGSQPLFELVKCIRRIPDPPMVLGSLVRLSAFLACYLRNEPRLVSGEFIKYLRQEQVERMYAGIELVWSKFYKCCTMIGESPHDK